MRRITYFSITAALLLLNGVAVGQLTYPIVETNQTLFYDNANKIKEPRKGDKFYGQDAQFEGNKPSYTDNGDGTITDNVTKLVWQKGYSLMSYDEAMAAAKSFTLGGRSDWRLPSIKEAYSLIMFSGVDASSRDMGSIPEGAIPFMDVNYFDFKYGSNGTRAIDTQMLSSTIYIGSSERQIFIFGVNMADGRIKSYPMMTREGGKKYTVRFVRGEEYGVNNFVSNRGKTISDTATGLMWQRDDSGKGMDWAEALEYAQAMNKKKHLGYSDWRLPNAKELQSIVDYTRSPESSDSAAIDPLFKVSQIKNEVGEKDYPFYWSSTTHCSAGIRSSGGSAAVYVSFGRGMGNMPQMQGRGLRGGSGGGGGGRSTGGGGNGGGSWSGGGVMSSGGVMSGGWSGGGGMGGGGSQSSRQQGGSSMQSSQGSRQYGGGNGGYGGGGNGKQSGNNWINIHGAGCQRSDPKSGKVEDYTGGRGPQGDAIRIKNYVRLVRDITDKK